MKPPHAILLQTGKISLFAFIPLKLQVQFKSRRFCHGWIDYDRHHQHDIRRRNLDRSPFLFSHLSHYYYKLIKLGRVFSLWGTPFHCKRGAMKGFKLRFQLPRDSLIFLLPPSSVLSLWGRSGIVYNILRFLIFQ